MDELIAFLRARLDEDEEAALGAKGSTSGRWTQNDGPPEDIVLYDKSGKLTVGQALHIARHDPARVLAEIEAKRDLLRLIEGSHDYEPIFLSGVSARMVQTLRLFALAYAGHPDYQPDWTP